MSLLEEKAKQWEAEWLQQGIEQGKKQGLASVSHLLSYMTERKFDPATAQEFARRIASVSDTKRFTEVGVWIIDCKTGAELLEKLDAQ